jgi:hypothetical protein
VQVEFNPQRVISWRQIGYAKHQLTKEQFRDNSVLAAEIAAQEAGNALYTVETKPDGIGPVATVYVRYKFPARRIARAQLGRGYDGNACPRWNNPAPRCGWRPRRARFPNGWRRVRSRRKSRRMNC